MIKISYAVTVCDELDEIARLLSFLTTHKREEDEIVVLWDSNKGGDSLETLLKSYSSANSIKLVVDKFDGHFADWKNKLTSHCTGDYIFQIDADEYPADNLIAILPYMLEENSTVEVYHVPRINTVEGLTQDHIRRWGWRVTPEGWVNFPDNQWRIWKKKSYIRWVNKVHERLDGFKSFIILPSEPDFCLIHPKTIERQEKQNTFYNRL
jgi:hypothetical protein